MSIEAITDISRRLINRKTGLQVNSAFLNGLKNKQFYHGYSAVVIKSSSDQMIHWLSQTCDEKYIVLYEYISCSQASLSYLVHNCGNKEGSSGSFSSLSDDFLENINSLKGDLPTGYPRLFLTVSCTTKDEAHHFRMYPEVYSFDLTQGTNYQKK